MAQYFLSFIIKPVLKWHTAWISYLPIYTVYLWGQSNKIRRTMNKIYFAFIAILGASIAQVKVQNYTKFVNHAFFGESY